MVSHKTIARLRSRTFFSDCVIAEIVYSLNGGCLCVGEGGG